VGFYSEFGNYVSVKKMKHLIAELLKWRELRRSMGHSSAIDAALDNAPLVLTTSARHNDMMLCCPTRSPTSLPMSPPPHEVAAGPAATSAGPPVLRRGIGDMETRLSLISSSNRAVASSSALCRTGSGSGGNGDVAVGLMLEGPCLGGLRPEAQAATVPASASSPGKLGIDLQRLESLERDSQRLRIENAELKKRVKFGSDFLHKEIRRLRIENAELKKRLFFSGQPGGAPGPQLQPVWVSTPAALLTPVVAAAAASSSPTQQPAAACGAAAPVQQPPSLVAVPSATVSPSGQASPGPQGGALTPIPQGFCYAVPLAQGLLSPNGQPWPSTMGPLVAMPLTAAAPFIDVGAGSGGATAGMSPHSDSSHQMRLLPRSLLSCSEAASQQSNTSQVSDSPGGFWGQSASPPAADVPAMQLQGSDDRWVCIPSGIVERQKAQFEDPGPGGAADGIIGIDGGVPPTVVAPPPSLLTASHSPLAGGSGGIAHGAAGTTVAEEDSLSLESPGCETAPELGRMRSRSM